LPTPKIARILQLAAAAAAGGLLSAGGYALASNGSTAATIHVCADRGGAHVLHLQARCHRGQRGLAWNHAGPVGAQGPAGPAAVAAWAIVGDSGRVVEGQGLSVQHVSNGTYQITVTASGCAQGFNAPVVSVSDSNPPAGQSAGAFPVAWVGDTGSNQQFVVDTGVVVNGSFAPTDHTFNVQDACS
jgi:hypothetical protein